MAVTIGNMANIQTQSAMAMGKAEAQSMGLGQDSANALAIGKIMGGDDDQYGVIETKDDFNASLINKTLDKVNNKKGSNSLLMSHEDQKNVLMAGMTGKGGILNTIG